MFIHLINVLFYTHSLSPTHTYTHTHALADPFEWIISYNLALVHLSTGQYVSAFHYLSASVALRNDFATR
jgi:hypothetical protein